MEGPNAAKPAGQVAGAAGARLAKGFCIYLIHILLPLKDNHGCSHERELFRAVAGELTGRFGGLTARTHAPAEGLWKEDSSGTSGAELVIYEVMAEDLDQGWWGEYRRSLEAHFRNCRPAAPSAAPSTGSTTGRPTGAVPPRYGPPRGRP